MFCPGCGLNEERPVQFRRACGADLGSVRETLEQPDAPEPAVTAAREEIARAELAAAASPFIQTSVTEHTTRHLRGEPLKTPRY
jgi:hypothetical protein